MATVFRPTVTKPIPGGAEIVNVGGVRCARWKKRGGKTVTCPLTPDGLKCRYQGENYHIRYTDHTGKQVTAKGPKSLPEAKAMAARLEAAADRIRCGLDPRPGDGAGSLLGTLAHQYADEVVRRGRAKHHCQQTRRQLLHTINGMNVETLRADRVDGGVVAKWLSGQRVEHGWSNATYNLYAGALRSFGKWLVKNRLAPGNPFEAVPKLNSDASRTFERRALTPDEFGKLLAATAAGPDRCGLNGPERAMLWRLAAYTGLRMSELASLTPESFVVQDGKAVTVTVKAKHSKRRKIDVQPVPASVGGVVGEWLTAKPVGKPVFVGWNDWRTRGAKMVREDLEAAGLRAETAEGKFDGHALRVQYITNLARAGVGLSAAQKLARHSTPTLTNNTYNKISNELKDDADKLL